ncbi:Rab guanine nucleotide exchange factor SEC2 [Sphaceloma murrayae]|uniref:Inheritance of peroxisomes protein 1 n=1 Tax=Sphaceloma murrayae TaxID=2082308 RepID=A0A2K1R2Z9_9PEZI|nr:Rab guanine nucleotide exchange factor SEC2 [Sphaceloma murrayae]
METSSAMVSSQTSRPITPQTPSSRMAVRRSVTVPSRLQVNADEQTPVEIGDSRGVETIYTHPSAKVVSFTVSPIKSNRRVSEGNGSGSLAYRTPTERTVAAGPLEIYRVPGSVSFLYSGALLHALMPRANCWCVDDVSTFILKVTIEKYYRIELPASTEEDLARVEDFKASLQKVLFYERTPCPFRRGFSDESPETPSPSSRRSSRFAATEPVKKWKLDGVWKPEDDEHWEPRYDRASVLSRAEGMIKRGETSPTIRRERPTSSQSRSDLDDESDEDTPRPRRPSSLSGMRSITAPPKLTLVASPPSKASSRPPSVTESSTDQLSVQDQAEDGIEYDNETEQEAGIIAEEEARKDSKTDENTSEKEQSGREHTHVLSMDLHQAQKQALLEDETPLSAVSQVTDGGIMSEDDAVESRIWSGFSTPSLSSDSEDHSWGEIVTPPETLRIRKNRKTKAAESLSQVSSKSQIRRTGSRESQRALTSGIVRKTCSIVLGPPAHLVSMMLKIAARITNGAFKFTIKSPVGAAHTVPGSWYVGDEEDDWDVDDYGFPIGVTGSTQKRASAARTLSID